ncbi:MAG TPA: trypsin-like serine protease [Firmicutes bacterium]|nr:trypsin-like serine protease [Bacillota bacterium]
MEYNNLKYGLFQKIALVAIVVGLALAAAGPSRAASGADNGSLRDIVRMLEPSVVWVISELAENEFSQGSGFIIHESGYLITNAHVVNGGKSISVGWPERFNRSSLSAEVIAIDTVLDMALLKVPCAHLPAIPVGSASSASVGDSVFALGFPAAGELGLSGLTVTRGILSAIRTNGDKVNLLQTDAAVTLGCSGGPLFDLDTGTVIGVVQGKGMFVLEGFNFAAPIENFFELAGLTPIDGVYIAIAELTGESTSDYSQPWERALESYHRALRARLQMDWGEALSDFLTATHLESEDPMAAFGVAESYAALAQPTQALKWLERAFRLGFTDFETALESPGFSSVRDDFRFIELVESF